MSTMNNNQNNNSRYQKRVTNYSEKTFQGVVYPTVEESITAGAKHHAKMDWATIEVLNEVLKEKITPAMLLKAKVELIERSMAKREEVPSEFR